MMKMAFSEKMHYFAIKPVWNGACIGEYAEPEIEYFQ